MKRNHIILITMLMAGLLPGEAQNIPGNFCYINNGRIYFQLDKRWTYKQRHEISTLFSLDSTLINRAFDASDSLVYDSTLWLVQHLDQNITELSKITEAASGYRPNDVFLVDDEWLSSFIVPVPIFAPAHKYGLNKWKKEPSMKQEKDSAVISLRGYPEAVKVYLSGTFNNWSTMQQPMSRTPQGWEARLKLKAGRYEYKFIVDGHWLHDANNLHKVNDYRGGRNSVLFVYNHTFYLKGFTDARKAVVTGSFCNWSPAGIAMQRVEGGWSLPVYLEQGTHAYKFIVDRQWITDPANPVMREDASGNMNSFLGIGDTMVFRLSGYTEAQKVVLAGSFNNWSPVEIVMNKTANGWEIPYVLGPGNYEYKFIVDGQWMPDPANPATSGTGEYTNSCLAFEPNYTFRLSQFTDAKTVIVTGSFNGWREDSFKMYREGDAWIYPIYLKPGKHTYKFLVDGQWLIDPANETWEENYYSTGNSVLWIEP